MRGIFWIVIITLSGIGILAFLFGLTILDSNNICNMMNVTGCN